MPDLPDELTELLRVRAEHAPVPAAASDRVVRAVRRRQHARAGAFVTGTALAVAGVVGVASALAPSGGGVLTPTSPNGAGLPSDPGTVCGAEMSTRDDLQVGVAPPGGPATEPAPGPETETTEPGADATASPSPSAHPATEPPPTGAGTGFGFHVTIPGGQGELRFGKPEYAAPEGSSCLIVDNDYDAPHLLRIVDEDTGATAWELPYLEARSSYLFQAPDSLSAGRYRLVCSVHPLMKATVAVS